MPMNEYWVYTWGIIFLYSFIWLTFILFLCVCVGNLIGWLMLFIYFLTKLQVTLSNFGQNSNESSKFWPCQFDPLTLDLFQFLSSVKKSNEIYMLNMDKFNFVNSTIGFG